MTLAVDSQEAGGVGHSSTTSPLNWSFTNTAGTLLLVGAIGTGITGQTPACTYNSVTCAAVGGTPFALGPSTNLYLFALVNPSRGAHTVSVSMGGTFEGFADILGAAISFTGQSSPAVGVAATMEDSSGTSSTASVSVSGTKVGSIIVSLVGVGNGGLAATFPTLASAIDDVSPNAPADNIGLGFQQTAVGGTVTAAWTLNVDQWAIAAVEVFSAVVLPIPFKRNKWYLTQ